MLVGRDAELRTATRAVAGLAGGQPFVIGIVGDDGSGRTSLLNTTAEIARSEGSLVLATRGTGAELAPAYGGLLSLLRPLERRFDELAGAENAEVLRSAMALRSRPAESLDVGIGVLRLMTTLAEERPLVVAVDDADGLDPATVDALAFAFGRLGVDAVGALICLPPERQPVWEPVTTQRLVLGPLGVDELAELVMANVPCEPEPAQACATWADGNPLLAIELARSLSDDERKGRRPLPSLPRPTVRAVERMQAQLDALAEGARRALVVVAADRTGRASVIVGALAALGEAPGGLDDAEEAGVISIDLDSVSFRHPLLRPLCYHLVASAQPPGGASRPRRCAHRAGRRRRAGVATGRVLRGTGRRRRRCARPGRGRRPPPRCTRRGGDHARAGGGPLGGPLRPAGTTEGAPRSRSSTRTPSTTPSVCSTSTTARARCWPSRPSSGGTARPSP